MFFNHSNMCGPSLLSSCYSNLNGLIVLKSIISNHVLCGSGFFVIHSSIPFGYKMHICAQSNKFPSYCQNFNAWLQQLLFTKEIWRQGLWICLSNISIFPSCCLDLRLVKEIQFQQDYIFISCQNAFVFPTSLFHFFFFAFSCILHCVPQHL